MTTPRLASLLLLADSRFPTGAHAHSAGVEASHGRGDVRSTADLASFLDGRLATVAPTEAAFAAAACANALPLPLLDLELAARTPSPRLRMLSRSLGRQLLRPAERAWPGPVYGRLRALHADGPMQPIALGAVAHCAGLTPHEAALCSLHHLVGAVTTAAVRLLGLDPFDVHAIAARLGPQLDDLAADAARAADAAIDGAPLPSTTSLLADILAEHHATWEVRLFAS
jgi:urease accessory protein